jgi:hypothetical protein
MPRQKRKWDSKFNEYMETIVNHPNYSGMPYPQKDDGTVRWVVTSNSTIGKLRRKWWDKKSEELGIEKKPGFMALVARKIHPTGEKPCQICGKVMKLDYIYPNKSCPYKKDILTPCNVEKCEYFIKRGRCSHLGPGAMSDAPDRFDGFHTYNRCHRSKEDTGRHAENLRKYGEDRRVYEFWAEGDWKTASWFMREFAKHKISPDHIGPISIGFCHRPKFRPMTKKENIAKGNRMTLADVKQLVKDEESGEQVVSWHSSFIWDILKHKVKDSADAKKLSSLMRQNLHNILAILNILHLKSYDEFLIKNFLHPEHALIKPTFLDFNPQTGLCSKIVIKKVNRTENVRNAKRYIKKSLKELENYQVKDNRKISTKLSHEINQQLEKVIGALSNKDYDQAKIYLGKVFSILANDAAANF